MERALRTASCSAQSLRFHVGLLHGAGSSQPPREQTPPFFPSFSCSGWGLLVALGNTAVRQHRAASGAAKPGGNADLGAVWALWEEAAFGKGVAARALASARGSETFLGDFRAKRASLQEQRLGASPGSCKATLGCSTERAGEPEGTQALI